MRAAGRFAAAVLGVALTAPPALADPPGDVGAAMRSGDWASAEAAAAALPDPVARDTVRFERLLLPGGGGRAEIAAFLSAHPDWPMQATLARRRDEALAVDPDDSAVRETCEHGRPAVAALPGRLRCAEALARAGRAQETVAIVRRAWLDVPSDAAAETRFLQRWAGMLTRDDQWRRFDALAWTDSAGARRQAARLDAADKPRAEARLAFRRDDPSSAALLAALPPERRNEPGLFLEHARWLRRGNQDDAALALWRDDGAAAESAAPPERLAAFWDERNLLARRRLKAGDAAGALALAEGHAAAPAEAVLDAEFLAGFVALRHLGDPVAAARHFRAVADGSMAAITQARGHYWLARAAQARGDNAGAAAEYAAAAAYPLTYYGQLATLASADAATLAAHLGALRDPPADPATALALVGREPARAAAFLVAWGEPRRAATFLLRLAELDPAPADQAAAARLAASLGLPDIAVAMARRAGREGVALPETGWPVAVDVPPDAGVDPALVLAVIRQESSFDPAAVSPAGARGLMQLMPATAAQVARQIGLTGAGARAGEPAINVRLGSAYLRDLLDRMSGAVPLAVAAYNAGPNRVRDWLAGFDPRVPAVASSGSVTASASFASGRDASANGTGSEELNLEMIDWIETIPFNETRNYVQRVIESESVYRVRRGEPLAHPLAAPRAG